MKPALLHCWMRIHLKSVPRLLHHLRLIRDLSVLAHEESMLFYYSNALSLHERAYHLEVAIYGTDSPAAAARWLHMGHCATLEQRAPAAHEFYSSALEYHKSILNDHADLRLIQNHLYIGRSFNSARERKDGGRNRWNSPPIRWCRRWEERCTRV